MGMSPWGGKLQAVLEQRARGEAVTASVIEECMNLVKQVRQ